MRIISHAVNTDLQNLLTEYAVLAHQFRQKSPQFIAEAEVWLLKAEAVFKKHNFPDVSKLARLSSSVAAARRGHMQAEKTRNPRSEKQFQCWQFLNEGHDLLHRYLMTEQDKLERAEGLIAQLVVIAFQKKILDIDTLNQGKIDASRAWQMLAAQQDFFGATLQLKALISPIDIIVLLDKVLDKVKN
ncbi:MAG: hypothetical protein IPK76_26515 [Lewinellaceae bacterium]|jgi:hypothetical protein|nr:hypothetical protein [Lewinellaceae bacterium]